MAQPPPRVDLHTHSRYSDGILTPEELVGRAAERGLSILALTDHDTVGGFARAAAAGRARGVEVIFGVELSAEMAGDEIHILGIGLDPDARPPLLAVLAERRRQRLDAILERLAALGISLGAGHPAFELPVEDAVIGRPHVARALVAEGVVASVAEAFSRFLRDRGPADVPKTLLPPREAVDLIHEAGGLALLAHPGVEGAERHLDALRGLGLDGLEAYHPKHSGEQTARYLRYAGLHGLPASGGSDFHAPGSGVDLGLPHTPEGTVDALRARLGT